MERQPWVVPLVDLRAQYHEVKAQVDEAMARVAEKGSYVAGEEVERFEEAWARYCGAQYCIAVSSGTDALYVAFATLGMFRVRAFNGDLRAVCPNFTFPGVLEPLLRANFRVHLVDVDLQSATSDYDKTNYPDPPASISLVTHLYGYPAPIPQTYWFFVEDAAQAHGLKLQGRAAIHSFYPTKNLGAMGQAGSIVTNDFELVKVARQLREHGEGYTRFSHRYPSGNYRMDELQAAILNAKLPFLDSWNLRRRELADLYRVLWRKYNLTESFPLQEDAAGHVYHALAIRAPDRNALGLFLVGQGVQTSARFPTALSDQGWVAKDQRISTAPSLANSRAWASTVLNLPLYETMQEEQVEYVCKAVRDFPKLHSRGGN